MFMGLFRVILWFFIISYLFKLILRFLAPILIKNFARKMQDRFTRQYETQQNQTHKEGEVIIEKKDNSTKKKSDAIGEYVDFEEVDE
tara:strand:+ start:2884 stop:3144 length:261 start_codon:yes stop_codon:yes gene_type:complete